MQPNNCTNAHVAQPSSTSLGKAQIQDNKVYTTITMTTGIDLVVCFATTESSGDSADDYIQLGILKQLGPPDVVPRRVVHNSWQTMTVIGGTPGSQVAFSATGTCDNHNHDYVDTHCCGATVNVTYKVYLTGTRAGQTGQKVDVGFSAASPLGTWVMCYKANSKSIWTAIYGKDIELIPRPISYPPVAIAGSNTTLTFTGSHMNDDLIVLTTDSDCYNAHIMTTMSNSLTKTQIRNDTMQTVEAMTDLVTLTICYATKESFGDSFDDWAKLTTTLVQKKAPNYTPRRTVAGSLQQLNVSDFNEDDQVMWTRSVGLSALGYSTSCVDTSTVSTTQKTSAFNITSGSHVFGLHSTVQSGEWKMCYKLAGGVWTHVSHRDLTIVHTPTFFPMIGIAAHPTALTFSSLSTHSTGLSGDIIVVLYGDCSNRAHNMTDSANSLAPTVLTSGGQTITPSGLSAVQALSVCYATQESLGDSPDDYVQLQSSWEQLR